MLPVVTHPQSGFGRQPSLGREDRQPGRQPAVGRAIGQDLGRRSPDGSNPANEIELAEESGEPFSRIDPRPAPEPRHLPAVAASDDLEAMDGSRNVAAIGCCLHDFNYAGRV